MISLRKRVAAMPVAFGLIAGVAFGQTTTTPSTCTTAPASITTFSIERVLTLSNLLTTLSPNVSPSILAGIAGGAQEIRSRLIYNPALSTVTDTTFLVAPGSPIPTPLAVDVNSATILTYTLSISQIYTSCAPTPSLLFVGTVSGAVGPYGNFNGALGAVSVGYTTDTPAKINNVVELIAGQIVAYSSSAQGSVTFPAAPVTPPGTNSSAPTVTLNPAPPASGPFQVFSNPFQITATGVDPNNLALTYSWTSNPPVNFIPSNTVANPQLYFVSGKENYMITVTVTNSAGQSTSTTFTVQYLGRN